jgi:putative ABC transport system permease protein
MSGLLPRIVCFAGLALRDLFSNKLQLVLTFLTIAIGALALSATHFTSAGALAGIWKEVDLFMGQRVDVYPDSGPHDALLRSRESAQLTTSDLESVREGLPSARFVVPLLSVQAMASSGDTSLRMSVDGIHPDMTSEAAYVPLVGRSFGASAIRGHANECMLTSSALDLFGLRGDGTDHILLDGIRFKVTGIVPDPPDTELRFRRRAVLPYALARMNWGSPANVGIISVAWQRPEDMDRIVARLSATLDRCRAPGAYHLSSGQFRIQSAKRIISSFRTFGYLQAAFCLLVAAIGIVNVMLTNVVRNMHEYSIRLTFGASRLEVALIVLVQASLIGLIGSSLGTGLGALLSPVLADFLGQRLPETTAIAPTLSLAGFVWPILVCTLAGFVAGLIPAVCAMRVDVLKALRLE